MIDDSDLKKISEHMESERKKRTKKENTVLMYVLVGLFLGMAFVAVTISTIPFEKYADMQSPAESEIARIQDLSCFDLKHFTPKFANPNFVTLELLQRCY